MRCIMQCTLTHIAVTNDVHKLPDRPIRHSVANICSRPRIFRRLILYTVSQKSAKCLLLWFYQIWSDFSENCPAI